MDKVVSLMSALGLTTVLVSGCTQREQPSLSSMLVTNTAEHSVNVFLTMSQHNENLGANFNGYSNGHLVINVPVGYKVTLNVTNDGGIPYLAGVYTDTQAVAFKGAGISPQDLSNAPTSGVMPGSSQQLSFVADSVGSYKLENLLYRFPTHHPTRDALGMWAHFNVTAGGVPSVKTI